MKISQHDDSISRAGYTPVPGGADSLHFYRVSKTVTPPLLSLERNQDVSPSSATKLAFSSVSVHKTHKPSSPRSPYKFPARNLWHGLLLVLLCLPLFLGFAAVEAQAQTLSISAPADANEGDDGTTDKFFTVSLSSAASVDVTYTICFTNSGTATRGASDDFQTLNDSSIIADVFGQCIQNKSISAGQTSDSGFGIRIRGDTDAEPDETVIAQLTLQGNPTGVTLGTSTATYTILDDDCPAQNAVFSSRTIDVLENGGIATYCVRLLTAPSGGDTTVAITNTGNYPGSVTFRPSSLTFTSSNYQTPQRVTVTGVDQPEIHLDRDTRLTHRANGGGYSNQLLNISIVNVYDAPELEAFDLAVWNANDFAAKRRPNTVKATRGFRYFQNDMTPIYPLRYQLRLSNRPATGETVTVTATSSDISKFGLSLTSGGTPQSSLTVTFEDRAADQVCFNGGHSSLFDVNTPNPDASWACYRQIWVISTQQYATFEKGCADITHTASGGGLRSEDIGTIRAHAVAGTVFAPYSAPGRDCPLITEELRTGRSAPAEAAPAPTDPVTNLQVTAVDDVSARITWDAVEHATSYEVSWSTESSDSLNASAGALPGVTGTSTTIQHDALVPMTLTVTVTPEYIDENGVTEQLDALASEATLEVGPGVQELGSGGGTNGGNGGSIDAGFGAVDLPVPVSHWRFEDDAVDWVGSSHGTEKGGVAFEANEEGEGIESYALSLDGTDDYIDLASHVSDFPLGDSTRSVTGWFKADTGNQRQTFFTYGPNVEGKRFSIAADRTQVLVAVSGHAWGVNGLELKDGWHHVAVTYAGGDSDDILIYLDGELQTASTLAGSSKQLDTQTGPAAIGRSVSGTKHYTGLIDDVRLYDVALSAEQVLALFEEHPQTVLAEDNQEVCVSNELVADVEGYSKETWRASPDHVERWLRVLETFSGTASDSRVMTPTEAEGYVNRGWPRWEPVLEALECLEEGNQ